MMGIHLMTNEVNEKDWIKMRLPILHKNPLVKIFFIILVRVWGWTKLQRHNRKPLKYKTLLEWKREDQKGWFCFQAFKQEIFRFHIPKDHFRTTISQSACPKAILCRVCKFILHGSYIGKDINTYWLTLIKMVPKIKHLKTNRKWDSLLKVPVEPLWTIWGKKNQNKLISCQVELFNISYEDR